MDPVLSTFRMDSGDLTLAGQLVQQVVLPNEPSC